ncbi:MAG: hypothetical protein AAB949_01425 [Patescibacteria group bacterium]
MVCDIEKVISGLIERDAVDAATGMANAFNEAGLEYGTDFVLNGVKEGKLHFSFMSKDSLNLAIKVMRGE